MLFLYRIYPKQAYVALDHYKLVERETAITKLVFNAKLESFCGHFKRNVSPHKRLVPIKVLK